MENTIEQIKSLVNTPLMKKPSEYELKYVSTNIKQGRYIKTYKPSYGDPTYWNYPNGVEKKIKDDKTYKVWFKYSDAADTFDSTTWYYVKYIEEVPDDKIALIEYLEKLLKELE